MSSVIGYSTSTRIISDGVDSYYYPSGLVRSRSIEVASYLRVKSHMYSHDCTTKMYPTDIKRITMMMLALSWLELFEI